MSKKNGKGDMDRISGLPDSVLLHILSFLPTKTCVSTMSLVSRRWRHLWEHLQVFHFSGDYNEDDDIEKVKTFTFFVNSVLTLRRSRDILKMHLDCCPRKEDEFSVIDFIKLWVRAAVGPCLEELQLIFLTDECYMVLPYTLMSCSNLVSLNLRGAIELRVQNYLERIYFPSLKKLYLDINYVYSIDALLTACPILETLNIINPCVPSFRFRVPPSLKRLEYTYYFFTPTYIDIDAPCLEYLSITIKGTLDIAVGNMGKVVEAYIDVSSLKDKESVKPLLNLLCAISETKHLTLCSSTTKLLLSTPIPDFPVFRCLLHLNLRLPSFNSKLLAKVLDNCHVLQDFVIGTKQKAMPLQLWEPQSTRIPNCLVSHLTSIHIKRYHGLEEELTFVEYILQNALVLKTIVIKAVSSICLEEKLCILQKIVNIPRGSNLCQVEFV